MSQTVFYSPLRQLRRELAWHGRLHGADALFGLVYAAVGFYAFRRVGLSQVYDVAFPFVVVSGVLVYLALRVCLPEATGATARYFLALPRDRTIAFDAKVAFLLLTALWLETCVLAGVWLKLGGAAITPHYRLRPDFAALPFLMLGATVWFACAPEGLLRLVKSAVVACLIVGALALRVAFFGNATQKNDYLPPRAPSLAIEWLMTALILIAGAWMAMAARRQWRQRQIGEIQ